MLFSSCGFISQDSWVLFRVLARERVLRISLWKPLDFPHNKEQIGIRGRAFDPKAQGETWEHQTASYRTCPKMALEFNDLSVLDDISDLSKWSCCYLFVCSRGLSFFLFCRGAYFPANYKDGTICKRLSHRTVEDSALGSLWHDFLLSLNWLCLRERRQANYISVLFPLVFWPRFSNVHLHSTKKQKPSSQEIKQEKGLPHCFRLKCLEPAMGQKRRLRSKHSVSHFAKGKRTVHPLPWACWLSGSPDSALE